jgi:hypothetical protein
LAQASCSRSHFGPGSASSVLLVPVRERHRLDLLARPAGSAVELVDLRDGDGLEARTRTILVVDDELVVRLLPGRAARGRRLQPARCRRCAGRGQAVPRAPGRDRPADHRHRDGEYEWRGARRTRRGDRAAAADRLHLPLQERGGRRRRVARLRLRSMPRRSECRCRSRSPRSPAARRPGGGARSACWA